MPDFTFTMDAREIDADLAKEIRALDAKKSEAIEALRRKMLESERYKAALLLVGHDRNFGSKLTPVPGWTGSGFSTQITMDSAPPANPAPPRYSVHIEPKILNVLLQSKMLNDSEKRRLLEATLPDGLLNDPAGV